MAYASKELKGKVNALLKEIIPKGWRWSLSRPEHRTLKLTIRSAPVDLPALYSGGEGATLRLSLCDIASNCRDEGLRPIFDAIGKAMDCDNYDESDYMTDYFNVGYYTAVEIGTWKKAFVVDRRGAAKAESREIAASIGRGARRVEMRAGMRL